ncbi:MAG TPA: hypothetical protein VJB63_02360 [Patescibacteria group bacterium]|nr:hypothetical protein [Patescibacteria group bacterium]
MKRETVITTIIGIIMGVIVAFIAIASIKEKNVEYKKVISTDVTPQVTVPLKVEKKLSLTIESPENDMITDQKTIQITGKTEIGALIVIQSPFDEKVMKNTNQQFTIDFPLSLGQNNIKISSHIGSDTLEKTVYVYFLESEK